ncbi:MAG: ABC transporter ATP-binding protein [Erysipelotrichaceae bacterium]|nr:ABC transporter ATP-binding protein [Erysipelotrichaceae bacterium]
MSNELLIKLENISKEYKTNTKVIKVLNDVNAKFYSGKFYAIMGHSGSGKSTLVNILALIDNFDSGAYYLYNLNIKDFNDEKLSNLRMNNIGFIFQEINLIPTLKAYENVMVPMLINKKIKANERKELALKLLKEVGLEDRIDHFPKELSGGEQQRVAIARALANDPNIIIADEPTGNLDEKTESEIFELLKKLSVKGRCIIMVSHSEYVKKYADEVLKIENGKLVGVNK